VHGAIFQLLHRGGAQMINRLWRKRAEAFAIISLAEKRATSQRTYTYIHTPPRTHSIYEFYAVVQF
jgi:hypothetical protein